MLKKHLFFPLYVTLMFSLGKSIMTCTEPQTGHINRKLFFNPTKTKQTQEVPLLQKVSLNNIPVARSASPKHLSLDIDQKLNFNKHINKKNSTAQKGKSVIHKIL